MCNLAGEISKNLVLQAYLVTSNSFWPLDKWFHSYINVNLLFDINVVQVVNRSVFDKSQGLGTNGPVKLIL